MKKASRKKKQRGAQQILASQIDPTVLGTLYKTAAGQPIIPAMLPPGWPYPGVDMTYAPRNTVGKDNNPFGPQAPRSEDQIDSAIHPAAAAAAAGFGAIPFPQNQLLGNNMSHGYVPANINSFTAAPGNYNTGTVPQPQLSFAPTFQPTFEFYHTPQGGMQYYLAPQAGDMITPQVSNMMMVPTAGQPQFQNNFNPQFGGQMMPFHNTFNPQVGPQMMPLQNNFNSQVSGQMMPFQNSFNPQMGQIVAPQINLMDPQLSMSAPEASQYSFDLNGHPPFVDLTRTVKPSERPILCIKNIPYTITHSEIFQFMQKYLLPHSLAHVTEPLPIHVVMERGTGKTQDCFVELVDTGLAQICIERYENLVMAGKQPKMGQRLVNVELSSQGELMKEIFPRAKSMLWDRDTGIPIMLKPVDTFCSGFRGFLTGEELNNVIRFAETPQRSPFAVRCQQRTYEMTMSTLMKFPWASIYYTLDTRDKLFHCFMMQLKALLPKVFPEEHGGSRNQRVVGLDARLVAAFVDAGISCPGFNEGQKGDICDVVGHNYAHHGVSEYANIWPFDCLSKPRGVGDQDVGAWLQLLKSGAREALNNNALLAIGDFLCTTFDQNGNFYVETRERERETMGFCDVARAELELMRTLLVWGWEKYFTDKGTKHKEPSFEDKVNEIQMKMLSLGVYENGIDRPDPIKGNRFQPKKQKNEAPADEAAVGRDDGATPRPRQEQQEVNTCEDPFHTRHKSIASDSGFSGMHRGPPMEMSPISKQIAELDKQMQAQSPAPGVTQSAEKMFRRPSYATALSHALLNTELANAARAGSSALTIKSPDGKELNFTPSSAKGKSPEKEARTFDPFNTPARHGSNASSDKVSPRTKVTSPKKTYSIKSLASPAAPQYPIGTPTRGSIQDNNTLATGASIAKQVDGDSAFTQRRRA